MQGVINPMLRRTLPFLLLTLLCGGYQTAQAQTPAPSPQGESTSAVVEKSADTTQTEAEPSSAPVEKPFVPSVRSTATVNRVGINQTQTKPLSLNDAIRLALENNNDIEVARNDVRIAETTLRSIQGFYDPGFIIEPTYVRNSVNGREATSDFTVNSDFSQNIKAGGGNFRVFYNNFRTENSFSQAQATQGANLISTGSSALFSSTLGFQFIQPLWRDREIDSNRRQLRIQRKRLEQSDADFRRRTIETIAGVQRAYWDLVFALRDQQNRQSNLDLTRENLRRVQAQIKAGAAAPLAEAEVATELATREADLLLAAQQVTNTENTLKQLLLRDPTAAEWSTPLIPTDEPNLDQTPVNLQDALAEAKQNRPELQRLELEREVNDIDIKFFKNQTKPQIDLVGTVSLDGIAQSVGQTDPDLLVPQFSGNDDLLRQRLNTLLPPELRIDQTFTRVPVTPDFLVGGYNQATRNLFRSDSPNYTVGIRIQFPLRNTTAKANLAGAQIAQTRLEAQRRQQEQTVIAEVRNAVQAVETARQRILTARVGRENAEKLLEGEKKLFEVGRSTTFILFERENALVRARNEEIRAQTEYNKALADLQRATSTTLRSNNIVIERTVAP
jgi:outer membrane protein